MAAKLKCPACGEKFEMYDDLEKGDVFDCPECYTELEIVTLKPLKVREADSDFKEEDEEDFEDE